MKPTPAGWPRISSSLIYEDAKSAIDWLCKAFGFEVRLHECRDIGGHHWWFFERLRTAGPKK